MYNACMNSAINEQGMSFTVFDKVTYLKGQHNLPYMIKLFLNILQSMQILSLFFKLSAHSTSGI